MKYPFQKKPEDAKSVSELFCDSNRVAFESGIIGLVLTDREFAMKALPILCMDPVTGEEAEDFSSFHLMAAYRIARRHVLSDPGRTNPDLRGTFDAFFDDEVRFARISETDKDLVRKAVDDGIAWAGSIRGMIEPALPYWLNKRRYEATHKANQYVPGWDPSEIMTRIAASRQQVEGLWEGRPTMLNFGQAIRPSQLASSRISLHRWPKLTAKLGGGLLPTECHGFLGATGSGKTMAATNITDDLASQGKRGLFITTEDPPSRLCNRMLSDRFNLHFAQMKDWGGDVGSLPADKRAGVADYVGFMSRQLMFKDWSGGGGSTIVENLDAALDEASGMLGGLDFFVLDWVGGALPDLLSARVELRHLYQTSVDCCVRACRKRDLVGFVFLQADPTRGVNNPYVSVEHTSECRSLARGLTSFVGISSLRVRDGDDREQQLRQSFYVSKSRNGEVGAVWMNRRGAYQRFEEIP